MSKIVEMFRTRLTWFLVGSVILSGLLAFGCGYLLVYFGQDMIDTVFDRPETNRAFQEKYMEDLQDYVDKDDITLDCISLLDGWVEYNSYVYISVYLNNRVIFNSDYVADDSLLEETESSDSEEDIVLDQPYLYPLELTDGTMTSVDIFCYDYWKYYYYVWGAGVGVGILLFIGILTRLLRRKLSYINDIEQELQILEGGNLEYPITIKGKDELASLANGIEQMRLSIIDNMTKEQKMLQANKNLVTSMSHDLRTPLTTLNGYLEILNMDRITDEQLKKHYLELSLEKTREIKELSDQLFEYFLIYGEDSKRLDVEPLPAYDLVMDLLENQFLGLEEKGFTIEAVNQVEENSGDCLVNTQYMHRVLNNILSNLDKYADVEKPIEVAAMIERNSLVIKIRNGIRQNKEEHESTKIGLITCERIMKLHHGSFNKYEIENEFTVKLSIPMR